MNKKAETSADFDFRLRVGVREWAVETVIKQNKIRDMKKILEVADQLGKFVLDS